MPLLQKKICLLGDVSVGKTSLVRRFVENTFDDKYLTTIGVKISRKTVDLTDARLSLLIWDLAGEDRFHHMEASYLSGAAGAIIVCDLTRSETVPCLAHYAEKVRRLHPDAGLIFVGNKLDLTAEILVQEEAIQAVANRYDAPFYLTSAKTGAHVAEMFVDLGRRLRGES